MDRPLATASSSLQKLCERNKQKRERERPKRRGSNERGSSIWLHSSRNTAQDGQYSHSDHWCVITSKAEATSRGTDVELVRVEDREGGGRTRHSDDFDALQLVFSLLLYTSLLLLQLLSNVVHLRGYKSQLVHPIRYRELAASTLRIKLLVAIMPSVPVVLPALPLIALSLHVPILPSTSISTWTCTFNSTSTCTGTPACTCTCVCTK